jgi:hypothetical protein
MLSLSRSLALSLVSLVSGASIAHAGPRAQIQTLVSAYTPGEQLSLEVTPDGRRGFLALGATIAMLDFEGVTQSQAPVQFDKHQVPDCQPLAMRYYHQAASGGNPAADYLFIAGGALGVWRLYLCSGIFSTPPLACPPSGYSDLLVQAPIENGYFERKRCVDVEILETATGPVLFALFASSSEHPITSVASTELRAYTWSGQTVTQIAVHTFGDTTPPAPAEVGTALAVDPADNDSIYVAMGKGGIYRADLSGGTLTATQIWSSANSCSSCPTCSGTHSVQHVRDLAIVRVGTTTAQSVLYAALNYSELLEITDLGTSAAACKRVNLNTPGYAERIAVVKNQGTDVWLAVVAQGNDGKQDDTNAPWSVNGVWCGLCIGGLVDPDDPPGLSANATFKVQFYEHDFASAGNLLTHRSSIDYNTSSTRPGGGTNSAVLQTTAIGTTDRLFLCSRSPGMEIYDLDLSSGTASAPCPAFVGESFSAQGGLVSSTNPGVVRFIQEGVGSIAEPKQMVYIDPAPPYGITPVPQTENSPCANPYPQTPGCYPYPAPLRGPIEPGLYANAINAVPPSFSV